MTPERERQGVDTTRGRATLVALSISGPPPPQIGQLVFKGVERLNRIQSVVFPTAYNTNQNLLICAPTGAGKTNIALLTVLHQVRQHLQPGGLIRKDQFKVRRALPTPDRGPGARPLT